MQKNASISREERSTGDTQTARLLQALQHKQKRIMCRQCIRECICTGILDLVMESPEQVVLDNYGGTVHRSRFVADNGKTYLLRGASAIAPKPVD